MSSYISSSIELSSSISSNNEYIVDKIRFRLQHDKSNFKVIDLMIRQNLNRNAGELWDFQQRKVKLMIINVLPVLLAAKNALKHIVIHQQLEVVKYIG
jgi:hypothetical protein